MIPQRVRRNRSPSQTQWPMFLLLVLTVIVPTACLLYFMIQTMESEGQAVRHRLGEVYRKQLTAARNRLEARWEDRLRDLLKSGGHDGAPIRFAAIVRTGLADGVVIFDNRGIPTYPGPTGPSGDDLLGRDAAWAQAQDLEFKQGDALGAANAYANIAKYATDTGQSGLALLARARCLARSGEVDGAIKILTSDLMTPAYRTARDGAGRLIQLSAMLRSLDLMPEKESAPFHQTRQKLLDRLNDYGEPCPSPRQRIFLMKALYPRLSGHGTPDKIAPIFPTLEAEELTADYLESHLTPPEQAHISSFSLTGYWLSESKKNNRSFLSPCRVRNLWQLALPESGMVVLFRQERLQQEIATIQQELALPDGAELALKPPGATGAGGEETLFRPTGWPHAGWQLTLDTVDEHLLADSANQKSAYTLWMGLLFITAIVAVAALMARLIGRQIRSTRLKNDLIATVTHELKTPLAAIRVLVDTLLDGHTKDPVRTQEYLELIARENVRLSRLIENFLTFSRMERNKKALDFAPTQIEKVVKEALSMMSNKLESGGFRVELSISENLPPVIADSGALVTVLINLLDNAVKYSADDGRVEIRVHADERHVILEVEDHGIGLTERQIRRVFDRFYQADSSLTRRGGGCGLGLSIVKFMVEAHGGTIEVASLSATGSTFTVRLPIGTDRCDTTNGVTK